MGALSVCGSALCEDVWSSVEREEAEAEVEGGACEVLRWCWCEEVPSWW